METKSRTTALRDYWKALERLKSNTPLRIPKSSPINNDTVALEAGRKRGSLKKSRKGHSEIINAIKDYNFLNVKKKQAVNYKINKLRAEKEKFRSLFHLALNRELMLVERLAELEKQLKKYENIIHFPGGR